MARKLPLFFVALAAALVLTGSVAGACGFLVAPNGAVRLVRTSTFVAWEDGVERYITNFEFAGAESSFGSIIPLPGEPTHVGKAGEWTLQRLDREVRPPEDVTFAAEDDSVAVAAGRVEVLLETRVDSLDIVVLRGGGADVAAWADDNGFFLGDGAGDLLDFYSDRSPYFLAARFDASAATADGFTEGDGIPILVEIPTERPWVPLHILAFDKPGEEIVEADVFLLTPDRPELLHGLGIVYNASRPARASLLDDLRSDEHMDWVPDEGWLTHLELSVAAEDLTYDLSVGTDGVAPSLVEAGLTRFELSGDQLAGFGLEPADDDGLAWPVVGLLALAVAVVGGGSGALVVGAVRSRPAVADRSRTGGTRDEART